MKHLFVDDGTSAISSRETCSLDSVSMVHDRLSMFSPEDKRTDRADQSIELVSLSPAEQQVC